jgi:Zn-finger nucleic acid-binding protein
MLASMKDRRSLPTFGGPQAGGTERGAASHRTVAGGGDGVYRTAAALNHRCPRCTLALTRSVYGDVQALECSACGGLFVTWPLLKSIAVSRVDAQRARTALPWRQPKRESEVRYLECPECSARMNRTIFGARSGIIVDVCKTDGTWFDGGELATALGYVERGGLLGRPQSSEARVQRPAATPSFGGNDDGLAPTVVEIVVQSVVELLVRLWW